MGTIHPSSDVTPSPNVVTLTRQLLKAGQLLDLPVLDHIVVGCGTYTSIRESSTLLEELPQAMDHEIDTTAHEGERVLDVKGVLVVRSR